MKIHCGEKKPWEGLARLTGHSDGGHGSVALLLADREREPEPRGAVRRHQAQVEQWLGPSSHGAAIGAL